MAPIIIWGEITLIAFLYQEMCLFSPKYYLLSKLLFFVLVGGYLQLFSKILVI